MALDYATLKGQVDNMKASIGSSGSKSSSASGSATKTGTGGVDAAGASAIGSMFSAGFNALAGLGTSLAASYDNMMGQRDYYMAQTMSSYFNREANLKQDKSFHVGWIVLGLLLLVVALKKD